MPCHHCRACPPAPPFRCFYCCCSVCGLADPRMPCLPCTECGALTHVACAQHPIEELPVTTAETLAELTALEPPPDWPLTTHRKHHGGGGGAVATTTTATTTRPSSSSSSLLKQGTVPPTHTSSKSNKKVKKETPSETAVVVKKENPVVSHDLVDDDISSEDEVQGDGNKTVTEMDASDGDGDAADVPYSIWILPLTGNMQRQQQWEKQQRQQMQQQQHAKTQRQHRRSSDKSRGGAATLSAAPPPYLWPPNSPALSRQLQARLPHSFYCSVDCALHLALYPNPQWNRRLSQGVEQRAAARWQALLRDCPLLTAPTAGADAGPAGGADVTRHHSGNGSVVGSNGGEVERETGAAAAADDSDGGASGMGRRRPRPPSPPALSAAATREMVRVQQFAAAHAQLRYEAWLEYFRLESSPALGDGGAHPPFLPPVAALDVSPGTLEHLSRVLSPAGQAERLYMLDPTTHTVGSVVVLPRNDYWTEPPAPAARLVRPGDSSAFVAETLALLTQDTTPVTRVANCFR